MPEAPRPPVPPAANASRLWRVRHSATGTASAMILFLAVSALWLVAAGTARAPVYSQPPCLRPPCLQFPSAASLRVWLWLGVAGAVVVLVSLVLMAMGAVAGKHEAGTARLRLAAVGLAGLLAELIVVVLVTHVAIVTAPLGFNNSGEAGAAIAILGVAQLPLAGALALAWARLVPVRDGEAARAPRLFRPGTGVLGVGGMVLSGAAFAAWSLRDGAVGMLVSARLIAGTTWISNVGAWWPGLFAAMVALVFVAAACVPGVTSNAVGKLPRAPSSSENAASASLRGIAQPGARRPAHVTRGSVRRLSEPRSSQPRSAPRRPVRPG